MSDEAIGIVLQVLSLAPILLVLLVLGRGE